MHLNLRRRRRKEGIASMDESVTFLGQALELSLAYLAGLL